jgi:CDP-diglyceride synthetase
LGDIGGMYQSIYFIGFMLVAFFTHRLFISAILKQLYQIKDFKDELPAH